MSMGIGILGRQILSYIRYWEGLDTSQAKLAECLDCSQQAVSKSMKRLRRRGLLDNENMLSPTGHQVAAAYMHTHKWHYFLRRYRGNLPKGMRSAYLRTSEEEAKQWIERDIKEKKRRAAAMAKLIAR